MRIIATILRGLVLSIIAVLVTIQLVLYIVSATLSHTVLSRETLSQWFTQPQTYQVIKQTISESLAAQSELDGDGSGGGIEQQQELIDLTSEYFDADKFSLISKQLIDGVFDWLEGEEDVDFEIKLFDNNQQLKQFFVDAQHLRLQNLEPCTTQELATTSSDELFNVECRPPDVSKQQLIDLINKAEPEQIDELYRTTTITDESLNLSEAEAEAAPIRPVYRLVTALPWLTMLATVLLLTLGLLVILDWRKWLAYSSSVVIVTPAIMLVSGLILWHSDSLRDQAFDVIDPAKVDVELLRVAIEPILIDISRTLSVQSLWLVLVAAIGLVIVNWHAIRKFWMTKLKRINS